MSLEQWLGLGAGALLVSFVVFAFRQGRTVKPDDGVDYGPQGGGGTGGGGDSSGT